MPAEDKVSVRKGEKAQQGAGLAVQKHSSTYPAEEQMQSLGERRGSQHLSHSRTTRCYKMLAFGPSLP